MYVSYLKDVLELISNNSSDNIDVHALNGLQGAILAEKWPKFSKILKPLNNIIQKFSF